MTEKKIECDVHGESEKAYVCCHLAGNPAGMGFNRNEPTDEDPFPDAWCDECERVRVAHDGWNEELEKVAHITLICSGCYERARIRNTHTATTLADLANLRWKCGTCDEWHTGPYLDFGYDAPEYWCDEHEKARRSAARAQTGTAQGPDSFLNEDLCVIEHRGYFVRGVIHLPIIGTAETFRWGVWGSLSKKNFETLVRMNDDPKRSGLPPMFSWLSNRIVGYPDTLSLKMYAHIQPTKDRPHFEIEPADHPLAQEFHHGISPERVREIMLGRVSGSVSG
jgi:hypothetical protein